MQMSEVLAWAQVLVGVATFIVAVLALAQVVIGAATFIVALLALQKENPPNNGGNSNHNDED